MRGGRLSMLAIFAGHAIVFAFAFAIAFLLRFDFDPPAGGWLAFWQTLPWVVSVGMVAFALTGQYRSWWGHITFADLVSLTWTTLCVLIVLSACNQLGLWPTFVPRSILLLNSSATLLLIGGLRSLGRIVAQHWLPWYRQHGYRKALLIAGSHSDKVLALYLHAQAQLPYRICGFLDSNSTARHFVGRVPVLGSVSHLVEVAKQEQVFDVVVIAGTLTGSEMRKVRDQCEAADLKLRILPPLRELVRADDLIPVRQIDLNTLLRREPVRMDLTGAATLIEGAVVMVTGAGGSIGSELCRQILAQRPKLLVLVDRSEPSLYQIDSELRGLKSTSRVEGFLADVADSERMRRMFELYRPQLVFHAAAHKHVPLLENHPGEAIKNNLIGTANLAELANEYDVGCFVFVSTDKSVKPASVMGASKRLAENYIHALGAESSSRFIAVRFGNVLGSAGSVVPLFLEQIRRGGPITLTHPDMRRYFMTINEAAHLVLQAAALGKIANVYVLDMGDPVAIVDLARDLVIMSGLPVEAIETVFTGPRPGEKLNEELYLDDEQRIPTPHPKVTAASCQPVSLSMMRDYVDELKTLVDGDDQRLIARLQEMVPDFVRSEISGTAESSAQIVTRVIIEPAQA